MTGELPELEIDHINRIRDDNCWTNLRTATRIQNSRNMGKSPRNKSGTTGVYWSKYHQKWTAQILKKHLGFFTDKDEAIKVRKAAELKYGFTND